MGKLLPTQAAEFSDPAYWKKFFAERQTPFEWYGDYSVLGKYLERNIKVNDRILQIGCGNSTLASELYDNGYRNVHSIDIEANVIAEQKRKNSNRPSLTFSVEDATTINVEDEKFNAILDKGTLDALLPPNPAEENLEMVRKMFGEVQRTLANFGRYIIFTLAQEHIVKEWFRFFRSDERYLLDVTTVPTSIKGFPMPVYILMAFKLNKSSPIAKAITFRPNDTAIEKMDEEELYRRIDAQRELSCFVSMCSRPLKRDQTIEMHVQAGVASTLKFMIVDRRKQRNKPREIKKYNAFVVPVGRETDYIFGQSRGRQELLEQADSDRLILVFLKRDFTYESLEKIKPEFYDFIRRFDCRNNTDEQIKILGVRAETDARIAIKRGESEINGAWVVEDIERDGDAKYSRRLFFQSSENLIQSEAYLKPNKKGKYVLDPDYLACNHHYMMISSLSLLPSQPLKNISNSDIKIAVLGLGGGLLPTFLLKQFPRVHITAVELDKDMLKVATEHFGFPREGERLSVKITDAMDYLKESARDGKLDAIFCDIAGSTDEDGLSCPPAPFLCREVLENMRKSLRKNGLLALNLVTRNRKIARKYRGIMYQVFPQLYRIKAVDEDLNELLIGVLNENADLCPSCDGFTKKKDGDDWKSSVASHIERITRVKAEQMAEDVPDEETDYDRTDDENEYC